MNKLYKMINKTARAMHLHKLESWSYIKWFNWWMHKNPDTGFWEFSAEYLKTTVE